MSISDISFLIVHAQSIPIDPAWVGLILQIPVVGVFVYFVLKFTQGHQASISRNHEEWRLWLTNREDEAKKLEVSRLDAANKREEELQKREDLRQKALIDQINIWYSTQTRVDNETILAITKAEQQLAQLTTLTLLIYAAINKAPLPDEISKVLKEGVSS